MTYELVCREVVNDMLYTLNGCFLGPKNRAGRAHPLNALIYEENFHEAVNQG